MSKQGDTRQIHWKKNLQINTKKRKKTTENSKSKQWVTKQIKEKEHTTTHREQENNQQKGTINNQRTNYSIHIKSKQQENKKNQILTDILKDILKIST